MQSNFTVLSAVLESCLVECYLLVTDDVNSRICSSVNLPLLVIETDTGKKKNEVKSSFTVINFLED